MIFASWTDLIVLHSNRSIWQLFHFLPTLKTFTRLPPTKILLCSRTSDHQQPNADASFPWLSFTFSFVCRGSSHVLHYLVWTCDDCFLWRDMTECPCHPLININKSNSVPSINKYHPGDRKLASMLFTSYNIRKIKIAADLKQISSAHLKITQNCKVEQQYLKSLQNCILSLNFHADILNCVDIAETGLIQRIYHRRLLEKQIICKFHKSFFNKTKQEPPLPPFGFQLPLMSGTLEIGHKE